MKSGRLINSVKLQKVITGLFIANGLCEDDANIVTNILLEAELCGITTHGISMVPAHIKKLRSGYKLHGEMKMIKETAAFTLCDANNAVGMLSAWKCMRLAVEKAAEAGIHMVLCRNCNTFSAAYCYVKQAVEKGMIGVVFCNSPAQMAPLGGCEKLLGTNPLAIGIPALEEAPFLLDMATSTVAKSTINQAFQKGDEKIPFGWATDCNGRPTNKTEEAVKGLLLPMAGAKGYGLSMAIDILAGLLSHSSYLDHVGRFYSEDNQCMNVGHAFICIDPMLIYGDGFYEAMDEYLRRIRNSRTVSGERVMVPGDINLKSRNEKEAKGVGLPEELICDLNRLLQESGNSMVL